MFQVEEIRHIGIDVSGLGPINFILEGFGDLIGNLISGYIGDWISGPLKGLIQGILDDMLPPVPNIKTAEDLDLDLNEFLATLIENVNKNSTVQ